MTTYVRDIMNINTELSYSQRWWLAKAINEHGPVRGGLGQMESRRVGNLGVHFAVECIAAAITGDLGVTAREHLDAALSRITKAYAEYRSRRIGGDNAMVDGR